MYRPPGDFGNDFILLRSTFHTFDSPVYLVAVLPKGSVRICRREEEEEDEKKKKAWEHCQKNKRKRVANANTLCCLHS